MKLLVISDTHGKLYYAQEAIKRLREKVAAVIHLGDMVSDVKALEAGGYGLSFFYVAGNCDFYFSAEEGLPSKRIIELNGVKILLTHGHVEGVKHGYQVLSDAAEKEGASIALCGHTHEPFNNVVNGVLCVNPGSISLPRGRQRYPSYAVLNVPDDGVSRPEAGIVYFNGA